MQKLQGGGRIQRIADEVEHDVGDEVDAAVGKSASVDVGCVVRDVGFEGTLPVFSRRSSKAGPKRVVFEGQECLRLVAVEEHVGRCARNSVTAG